ncbi:MAG: retropepsin-like aspartic protease [Candidatus Omnitrophota bacterium]|jgi:clan AA aspartic protease (TIGR02281 family)
MAKGKIIKRLLLIFIFMLTINAYADILHLKNGRRIEGIIKNEGDGVVELEVYGGTIKIRNLEIENIERSTESDDALMRQAWENQKSALDERLKQVKIEEERKPKEVEFLDENQSITVKALLNGELSVNLVLDTGASAIMLKKSLAEKLGIILDKPDAKVTLADGKKVDAKHVILQSVKVQDSSVSNVDAVMLMDEDSSLGPVDGLLGMSYLKHFSFKIDRKSKKLILEKL